MQLKNKILGLALLLAGPAFAQVDLINKVKDNQSEHAKEGFQWETVVDVERLAVENRIPVRKGVYVAVPGPTLETRAEYRMLRGMWAAEVTSSQRWPARGFTRSRTKRAFS